MNRLGRYRSLILINIIYGIITALQIIINFPLLLFARFILGVLSGIVFSLVPVFRKLNLFITNIYETVSETTPDAMRGATGALTGLLVKKNDSK